jgi:hypothetical protein
LDHFYLLEIILFGAVFIQFGSTADVLNRKWKLFRNVKGRQVEVKYNLKLIMWKSVARWTQQSGHAWFAASLESVFEHVCALHGHNKVTWLYDEKGNQSSETVKATFPEAMLVLQRCLSNMHILSGAYVLRMLRVPGGRDGGRRIVLPDEHMELPAEPKEERVATPANANVSNAALDLVKKHWSSFFEKELLFVCKDLAASTEKVVEGLRCFAVEVDGASELPSETDVLRALCFYCTELNSQAVALAGV